MEEGRSQMESLIKGFYEIAQCVKRLGCRLRSDIENIDRLEANFSNQLKDLENLEQRFLFMEKNLYRGETKTSVGEGRQTEMSSGTEGCSSVEQNEEPEEEKESAELLSASLLTPDTERILKLNAELLELKVEWKREKEELLHREKQLEEQIRSLQEHSSRLPKTGKHRDVVRKREATKGSVTLDILDKTLFPIVVQCFVALREKSQKRRIESSCILIQRIFRGYAVRKRVHLTHRPMFIVHRQRRSAEHSDSVFTSDAGQSLASTATAPDHRTSVALTGEHHIPSLTSSSSSSSSSSAAAAAAEDDEYNNNKAKEGSNDVRSLSNNRPKPRKGSLTKILQPTKTKVSPASWLSQAKGRSWSVSGTTEWQDPTDTVIHGFRELKQLEIFFADKIAKLNESSGGKSSVYDVVFAEALQEFHSSLTTQLSSVTQEDSVDHRYKDLMSSFERVLRIREQSQRESGDDFPHPLFVNAFRGFMGEFLKKRHNRELPNIKTKKDQQKPNKSKRHSINSVVVGGESLPGNVGLSQLASSELLIFVDRLTAAIESKGLSVIGLYRVAGNAVKIKQLIKDMTAAGASSELDLGERGLHVMTSVLKAIFREMPQPLIPPDLYEDFIQHPDKDEKSESLAIAINKLPEQNRELLNRLITHLVKVAQHESSNLMSANALAIVFAPCLLRSSDVQSAPLHESLNHIQKQTACLQFIIESQMEKMKNGSDNLKSSDADTIKVTDIDTAMLDYISATEVPQFCLDINVNDNDSASANEADMATTSEGSVVSFSCVEDEQKRKTDDEESLSVASDYLDLDFNVNICSEDGDDDLELRITTQLDDLSESSRTGADDDDDDDVASSPAPQDEVAHDIDHEEATTMNLNSSEDSSKDLQQQNSSERPSNTVSSASVVN